MLQLRQQAYIMYVEQGMTAKYIADTLGINKNTFSHWCKQGNWKQFRDAQVIAPTKLIGMCYEMSRDIIERAEELGGIPLKFQTETLCKLATIISKFEKQREGTTNIKAITELSLYLEREDPAVLQSLKPHLQKFLRQRFGVFQKPKRIPKSKLLKEFELQAEALQKYVPGTPTYNLLPVKYATDPI